MQSSWHRLLPSLCLSGLLFACGASGSGRPVPDSAQEDAGQPKADTAPATRDDVARLADVAFADQAPSGDVVKLWDAALPDLVSSGDAAQSPDMASADSTAVSSDAPSAADAVLPDSSRSADARTTPDAAFPDAPPVVDAGRAAETGECIQTAFTHLLPLELKTLLDSGEDPFLINVKGTSIKNIPGTDTVLANDVAGVEDFVKHDLCANIVIYCRTGVTSQSVGSQLIADGYKHVRDLAGGITAWQNAGYPTM
jgi:rhodanese-related sulfurtransferase